MYVPAAIAAVLYVKKRIQIAGKKTAAAMNAFRLDLHPYKQPANFRRRNAKSSMWLRNVEGNMTLDVHVNVLKKIRR